MFMSFNINITDVTGGAGTASLFGTPEVTPGLNRGSCNSGLIFNVVFCRSLFVSFLAIALSFALPTFRKSSNASVLMGQNMF